MNTVIKTEHDEYVAGISALCYIKRLTALSFVKGHHLFEVPYYCKVLYL